MFTKAGRILEYGTTDDSRPLARNNVVASWWVATEKDRRGNAIAYVYYNDLDPTGSYVAEHYPARIDYTSGPGVAATRSVQFEYQDSKLHSVYYRGGMKLRRSKLVQTIRTFGPGQSLVRAYHFDYVMGNGTKRMLVDSVHECAGDGTCKPATRLGWSSHPSQGFTAHEIGTRILPDTTWEDAWEWFMADVNGDGLDDIVFTTSAPDDDSTSVWYVALNLGGDYATPQFWAGFPYPDGSPVLWTAVPFDYDQDGLTDIFLDGPNISWATYKVLRAQPGGGFELIDTGISRRPRISIDPWEPNKDAAHGFSRLGDVDGDGVADLILCDNPALDVSGAGAQAANGQARWSVNLWSPDGAAPGVPGFERTALPIDALNGVDCTAGLATMYVADVDGDGKAEIVTRSVDDPTQFYAYSYEGGGAWTARPTGIFMPDAIQTWARIHFLDLNGDGLTDAVMTGAYAIDAIAGEEEGTPVRGQSSPWAAGPWSADLPRKWMNHGGGFPELTPTLPHGEVPSDATSDWTDWYGDKAVTLDYLGGGQQDLMMPMFGHCGPGSSSDNDACWVVMHLPANDATGVGNLPCAPAGTWFCQSLDASEGGYMALIDTHIAFPTPRSNDDAEPSTWFLPKVTDADGDGRQDFLVVDPNDAGHFVLYKNDGPQDLLVSVTTGTNPLDPGDPGFLPDVSIAYGTLIDFDTTGSIPTWEPAVYERVTYNPRSDPDNGCAYPRACVVGNERVVSQVVYNDGANAPRTFEYRYRDGRYHRLGRGFLGFGERIVLDDDTGGGTAELYDNETFDDKLKVFPFAGQIARAWAWQPVAATQAAPTTVELTYTRVEREEAPPDLGVTYFTLPRSTTVTREEGTYQTSNFQTLLDYVAATEVSPATVLGEERRAISMHDGYGNVWGESEVVDGADTSIATTRTFMTDAGSWQIAFVLTETTCATSLAVTQCRSAGYVPDPYGDVVSAQVGDPADPETQLSMTYGRDLYGNLVSTAADDAYGHHRASCTVYDEDFTLPARHRDAAGHVSLTRFDPGLGVPTAAADPNGLVVQWAHDGFGRVTEELRPDGTTTTTRIDRDEHGGPAGNWWEIVTETAADGGGRRTTHQDALGRPVVTYAKGPDVTACDGWLCTSEPWYEQEAHYDHLGRLDRVSLPHLSGDPASAVLYDRYDHDAAGRVTRHTTPWGAITAYAYTGLTASVTDWTGTASTQVDALGRVVETFDKEQSTTQYAYGPFGVVWAVVGPDGTGRVMLPDDYGRVRSAVDPDCGESVTHYDGFGEITGGTDARGWTYTLTHDALGRLVKRGDHDGTTTWMYDSAPHGIGRIASVTSPSGNVEAYGYDPWSRPASVALTVEGETFASTFTYDGLGRLYMVAYPQTDDVAPLAVRREHDSSGNVIAVRDNASGATYWSLDQVDGAGRATVESLADGATTTRHEYDAATGAVTAIVTERGKQKLQDLRYAYDPGVRLTSRADGLQPVPGGVLTERFYYDALDRLTCAAFGAVPKSLGAALVPPDCALSLQYQPNGNIDVKSDVGSYAYDAGHPHAVAGLVGQPPIYGYDATGNQTQRPGATIDYTAFDLPASIHLGGGNYGEDVAFDYDGNQKRVRKLEGSEETIYAGDLYEQVTDAAGDVTHLFFIGTGSATVVLTRASGAADVFAYVHPDALGSVERGQRREGARARAAELRRLRRAEERAGVAGRCAAARGGHDGAGVHRARGGRGARAREHAGADLRSEGREVLADRPGRERAALQPELEPLQLRVEQPAGVHGPERVRAGRPDRGGWGDLCAFGRRRGDAGTGLPAERRHHQEHGGDRGPAEQGRGAGRRTAAGVGAGGVVRAGAAGGHRRSVRGPVLRRGPCRGADGAGVRPGARRSESGGAGSELRHRRGLRVRGGGRGAQDAASSGGGGRAHPAQPRARRPQR